MRKMMFILGSALVVIACGGPGVEEQQAEIETWLVANGTPAETAECVARGTVDRFSVSDFEQRQALGEDSNLNEDDESNLGAVLVAVTEKCAR